MAKKHSFKKGDRVEHTWPNFGNPTTDQGTVKIAHRDGTVTIVWDHNTIYKRPMWWSSVELLTKLDKESQ